MGPTQNEYSMIRFAAYEHGGLTGPDGLCFAYLSASYMFPGCWRVGIYVGVGQSHRSQFSQL